MCGESRLQFEQLATATSPYSYTRHWELLFSCNRRHKCGISLDQRALSPGHQLHLWKITLNKDPHVVDPVGRREVLNAFPPLLARNRILLRDCGNGGCFKETKAVSISKNVREQMPDCLRAYPNSVDHYSLRTKIPMPHILMPSM